MICFQIAIFKPPKNGVLIIKNTMGLIVQKWIRVKQKYYIL